jgi:hypothetical protein
MSIIYIEPLIREIKSRELSNDKASEKADQYYYDFYYEAKDITDYVRYLDAYLEMFKMAFNGIRNVTQFVQPSKKFSHEFHSLIATLKEFQNEKGILKGLPKFYFDDYCNFELNIPWMVENYPKKIQNIEGYMAKVQQLFFEICRGDYYYAPYLKSQLKKYHLLINQHKKKRGILSTPAKLKDSPKLTLQFTKEHDNKKKKVYQILEKHVNNDVDKKYIMRNVPVSYDSFRSIIAQLKDDIVKQGFMDCLKIEADGTGKYKLVSANKQL